MKLDDIVKTLRSAHDAVPSDALRAAVPHADAMAPQIWELSARFCRGIKMLPDDEHELFYGLHVLAAAKHLPLWSHLVDLARVEPHELEAFFADHAPISLAALMLSVWDGDIDRLLRLIEHADLSDNAKWALFDVLARLTAEGRISRETTLAFLERYEHEGLADPDSALWWGWLNAVTCLGLTELEPAIDRVFAKPACEIFNDRDRAEHRDELAMAAAKPGDLALFDRDGIAPVLDPADALAWIERRREYLAAERAAEAGTEPEPPHIANDPARDIRLSAQEEDWLRLFLVSRQVPATTMSLHMLDGFLTALTIGPRMVSPEEFLAHVWGTEDGTQPDWDGETQQRYVQELIARIVEGIAMRKRAGAAHVPLGLDEPDADYAKEAAADWVDGFLFATELLEDHWQPLFDNTDGLEDTLAIQSLVPGDTEYFEREATTRERGEIIARLPEILRRIANFWLSPEKAYPRRQPVRVEKVGRNDPCPCGSGQKYKKCCALKPPPVMH